jgi:glycosyltransferase involved in cell wall biosynthesis
MSKPVAIAHLIATNFYGGPEKQIITHALRLNKDLFRFLLISFVDDGRPNELVQIARDRGIHVVELHSRGPFDPGTVSQLVHTLRREGIRLLCAHGYKANVIGRLASWLTGIQHIAVSRGWTAENRRIIFYEILDRRFLRYTNHIVAVSEGQKKKIVSLGISPQKISVIHNAIDLGTLPDNGSGIRTELGIPADGIFVVSAGRLSPEKNQAGMIDAARLVARQNSSVYFAIFGEGFLRKELEQRIRDAGLEERFFLPGFRSNLQSLFHDMDIFMLPSFTEGLPNVALEAFAARKPIVATAVGGTPEVVQDGISGFLTTPDNIAFMAESVLRLAADPALRRQKGASGYRHVAEEFTFEGQTRKYEELYGKLSRELVKKRGNSRDRKDSHS